ncbi:MAG: iron-containing redox enzyme family protein [Spongiibacteraceae bacterium]
MEPATNARSLYFSLLRTEQFADAQERQTVHFQAREFLHRHLLGLRDEAIDLPADAAAIADWIHASTTAVGLLYRDYIAERQDGAERRYFKTKSHAIHFLTAIAPTKLVDGAWLYGLTAHWNDPRLRPLIRIYLEELGDGDPALNHVLLYQKLLAEQGTEINYFNASELHAEHLSPGHFLQGALQLALAHHADEFFPEVIGFNLGYEQLPLHLLITAYELRELGIDPYYFKLHVTIDNSHSGHAYKALEGLLNALPDGADAARKFMQRVRRGYALNHLGVGSLDIIESFDLHRALVQVLVEKSRVGQYLHADYCRVAGRTVTDWLRDPKHMPQFLQALEDDGWIKRGQAAEQSRFWSLLNGDKAKMFGVFTAIEQQLIRDWIEGGKCGVTQGDPRFRERNVGPRHMESPSDASGDLYRLRKTLAASRDRVSSMQQLRPWLSPTRHHTAAGLFATRTFVELMG